jgi:uncharacterized membrane-anchored protein YitT (DUF2179 family)
LVTHTLGWHFGYVLLGLNLPFLLLALRTRSWAFNVKSVAAVAGVGWLAETMPNWVSYARLDPPLAAILGGVFSGVGLLVLFRHGASCGGMGILALHVQERTGVRAGWLQLAFDLCLFAVAAFLLDGAVLGLSLLGCVVMNLCVALNHRRDWYVAG